MYKRQSIFACLVVCISLLGCNEETAEHDASTRDASTPDTKMKEDGSTGFGFNNPDWYGFESRSMPGENSVSYTGQVARHHLFRLLKAEYNRIAQAVITRDQSQLVNAGILDAGPDSIVGTNDDELMVYELLDAIYAGGTLAHSNVPLPYSIQENDLQLCQADFSVFGDKNLLGKTAGEDEVTDHKDWDGKGPDDDNDAIPPAFVGWNSIEQLVVDVDVVPGGKNADVATPVALLRTFFRTFEARAEACFYDGECSVEGADLFVLENGVDLLQMTDKLLRSAVAFSQTADDYLDDDANTDGKGLLASNESTADPYTPLEHQWDEGFGYFGAASNFAEYTDEEILSTGTGREDYRNGYNDHNQDGCIDVNSEVNYHAAVNAAKRDVGSASLDLTDEVFRALYDGRKLIAETAGALSSAQLDELRNYRDTALSGYEKVMAATVIHYINKTLAEMQKCGTNDYSFAAHAKYWSEMKGFAFAFQFNPHSAVSDTQFEQLHTSVGDAPILCDRDTASYQATLEAARTTLAAAFAFDAEESKNW